MEDNNSSNNSSTLDTKESLNAIQEEFNTSFTSDTLENRINPIMISSEELSFLETPSVPVEISSDNFKISFDMLEGGEETKDYTGLVNIS